MPVSCQDLVPKQPSDVDPDWLTDVLRCAQVLHRARISSLRSTRIGEQGFVGHLIRFELFYDRLEADAPRTVVAKFASLDNPLVPPGELEASEAMFYVDMAGHESLAAPRCFYSSFDLTAKISVQILEDLGHMRELDITAGCAAPDVLCITERLAKMHAHWWESRRLYSYSWLQALDSFARVPFGDWWPRYPSTVRELLGDFELTGSMLEAGDYLTRVPDIFCQLSKPPRTCLHRDLHGENVFVVGDGPRTEDRKVVFFDWEQVAMGRGPTDLAYFLASSVAIELRRELEPELLTRYYAVLMDGGVRNYSWDQCWHDYRLGIFGKLLITVSATVLYDNTDPGRRAWRRQDLERLQAFLEDHKVLDLL